MAQEASAGPGFIFPTTFASRPALVLGALFLAIPFVILFWPQYIEFCLIFGILATPRFETWRACYQDLQLSPLTRTVSLFVIWAFVTVLWAADDESERLVELTVIVAMGGHLLFAVRHLRAEERRPVRRAAIVSFISAALLFLVFAAFEVADTGLAMLPTSGDADEILRGQRFVAFAALMWPMIGLILTARVRFPAILVQMFIVVCLIGVTAAFFQLSSMAGLLSVAVGGVVLLLVSCHIRAGSALVATVACAYLLLTPSLHIWPPPDQDSQFYLLQPLVQELENWNLAAHKIFTGPILGFGFQSSDGLTLEAEENELSGEKREISPPNNIFLLTWIEFGLVGVMLLVGIMSAVAVNVMKYERLPLSASLMAASAMSYLTPAVFGVGAWDIFWLAGPAFIGAACLLLVGGNGNARRVA